MAFLRIQKQGKYSYLLICEGSRNKAGKVEQKVLHRLGRLESYNQQSLINIAAKLYTLGGGDVEQLLEPKLLEQGRFNYGFPLVLKTLMNAYDLSSLLDRFKRKHRLSFDLFAALQLMLCDRFQDPLSKLATYDYQEEYLGIPKVKLQHLYRTLDILGTYETAIQQHLFRKNRRLFKYEIEVVFFDVTTFYFDSQKVNQGSLRQKGFSKDGKIGKTQVVFGLLIDKHKNPIAYHTYAGDQYEGHTLVDAIAALKKQYPIGKVSVVADRDMMNKANLALFEKGKPAADYHYIIGERLKSLPKAAKAHLCDISNYKTLQIPSTKAGDEGEKLSLRYTT